MNNVNDNNSNNRIRSKSELVEQMMEMALGDPNLSERELDSLCDYLEKEGHPELREAAMERYWERHPLSEENVTPNEDEVRRGWAEFAAKMDMNTDIDHYRAILAERERAKASQTGRESYKIVPMTPTRRTLPLWRRASVRVAAVLIPAAMIVGGYFWFEGMRSTSDGVPAMVASAGEERAKFEATRTVSSELHGIKQVVLADGTEITLNRNSTFAYNDHREGELTGEAYFKVAKDAEHPFVIHSDRVTVTVLGTEFNFHTGIDDHVSALSLYEGLVQLDYDGGSDRLEDGGMEFTLDHATAKADIHRFDAADSEPEWMAVFTRSRVMGLDEIFRSIESAYGVCFKNMQSIDLSERYSFRIASGEPLDNILASLQSAGGGFEYTIDGDTVELRQHIN